MSLTNRPSPPAVLLAALALVLAAGCLPTLERQVPNDVAPASGITNGGGEAHLPPEVQVFTLRNGLTLIVHESHAGEIVTVNTWVATGSANESEEDNGVSHFLEHLLFKGTDKYGPRELDRRFETLGSEINAATGDDTTNYYVTVAARNFEAALELHADMLLHASLPAQEIDHERKVVIEEINRANDNPRRKLYIAMQEQLFKVHPYKLDTLGPARNIADIPREKIVDYYKRWYVPSNMTVVIAGNITAARAKELVEKHFNHAPAKSGPRVERPAEPPLEKPLSRTLEDPRLQQAHLALAWHTPAAREIDDNIALDVAALVLGQGESSRLHQRLVERERLALSVSTASYTQRDSGVFYVYAVCEPQNVELVRAAIEDEITKIARNPVTLEEIEKAKLSLDRDFVYNAESSRGVASLYGYYATIADFTDVFRYRRRLAEVDPLRVVEVARRYLRSDRTAGVRMLPQGFDSSKVLAPPARATGSSNGTESNADSVEGVVRTELSNGTVLLVRRNRGSPVLAFHGLLAGGTRVAGKPGLADLAARVAQKETASRSVEALAREIDGAGISLSLNAGEDSIALTGTGLKGDLPHLLVLLKDVFYNATFPAGEVDKERERMLQELKLAKESPSSVAFEKARQTLFPDHPYGDVGSRIERALPTISRDDLVAFYRSQFRPERLTLAVAGNVDPAEVAALVTELFPPRREPAPLALEEPRPQKALSEPKVVRTPRAEASQSWLVQGYLVPGVGSPDYAALKLVSTLLGHGLSSRLFVNLREKRGLAYTTSAAYGSALDPTGFFLYIGTDPINTRAVQEGFEREIARLRETPVSAEELAEAKSKFLGAFHLAHEKNSDQAFYLAFYERAGLGFEFDQRYPSLIEAVTAEQIQQAAQKYFSRPSVKSLVGPAGKIDPDAKLPSLDEFPEIPEGVQPHRTPVH